MERNSPEIVEKETITTEIGKGGDNQGLPSTPASTLMNFLSVITRWRRFIVWFVLSTTLVTMIAALLSSKWYKSTASVFPAEQADLFPGLEGVSSLAKSFAPTTSAAKKLGSLTGPTELDRYVAILKSATVLNAVVEKFDLVHKYNYESSSYKMEKTAKELLDNTAFEIQDEGNLTISVYDKDPVQAAQMANYFVELLNKTNAELKVQNARGNRAYIEQRYLKNLDDLRKADDSLKAFQLRYGIVALPQQLEASINAVAQVYGTLIAKEVELSVAKRSFGADHPIVKRAQLEVNELRRKIADLNQGTKNGDPGEMKILVPFRQAPELAADFVRLFREVEIQYRILQFITPLYEQAKMEEIRSTPSVVVLDYGGVPERKAKPKVSLYTLLALVISTMISLLVAFTREAVLRLKAIDPDRYNRITSTIRSDWFGLRLQEPPWKKLPWKKRQQE